MYKPERLAALCDGVIAIAITLLVLGLEVPSASKIPDQELKDYLWDKIHPMIGFVTSFILIGTYWLAHYSIFHHIRRVDRPFIALNGFFLLLVSFVPFPTGVQASYRGDHMAFLFYATTQLFCGGSLLLIWLYATRDGYLVDRKLPLETIHRIRHRILLTMGVCLLAMGLSMYNLMAGRLVFLLIPVLYFVRPGMDGGVLDEEEV